MSPAEPPSLRALGISSVIPEQYGSDFLYTSEHFGIVGVQRKELNDLVASIRYDDRLAREVIQMKECDVGIWLIEGRPVWCSDGQLASTKTRYTHLQHLGLLFTLLFQGFSLVYTDTIAESGLLLSSLERWLKKEKHRGIVGRVSPRGEFGTASTEEWETHFLTGLPGISGDRARLIRDHFGGMPLRLTGDLREVKGIGAKTASRIEKLFSGGIGAIPEGDWDDR